MVEVLEATGIARKVDGWYDMVHDKCFMNELTDVHVENGTAFVENSSEFYTDNYIYANYLTPGLHKFLIYSPQTNQAYMKSMLVGVNTKDQYPELPRAVNFGESRPPIKCIWRQWIEDSPSILKQILSKDIIINNVAQFDSSIKNPKTD